MNLVHTLLIGLAILISGSFAYLDPGLLKRDTESMAKFFEEMICGAQGDQPVLSTIRTILESLLIYHLPAETALESIEETREKAIEERYIKLINMADNKLGTNISTSCNGRYMGLKVGGVFNAVLEWTMDYLMNDRHYSEIQARHPSVVNYIHQKLFVLILQVFETAKQKEKFDTPGPSVDQTQLRSLAAWLMSKLDMDRLCVCEGIMLSVFLKRPFTDLHDQKMAEFIQRLNFHTMWDGFGLVDSKKTALTAYMEKIVDRNGVPDEYLHSLHLIHFYDIVVEIRTFLKIAKDEGMNLKERHQRQILLWTTRVWDSLCKPEQDAFISKVRNDLIAQMIYTPDNGGYRTNLES